MNKQGAFFFKINPIYFILLALLITVIELLYFTKISLLKLIFSSFIIVFISYYYIIAFYYFITNKKFLEINIFRFLRSLNRDFHFNNQIKVVIIEEIVYRVIPIQILILLNFDNIFSLSLLTLIFIFLHFKKNKKIHLFIKIEFFLFFLLLAVLYQYFIFFPIIFTPHFIRNIFINYYK